MLRTDSRVIALSHAVEVAGAIWPTFIQRDGCIVVELKLGANRIDERPLLELSDRTEFEALANKTSVLNLFEYDPSVWSQRRSAYKRSHPLWKRAERLARTMAASWFCKLRDDFPMWRFRVYMTLGSGPTVRFHRVREGEPFWYEPDAASVANGELVLLDTATCTNIGRER